MSMRTMARSSSKRKSASDLASSVLPTPVGPRKRNEPVGRSGSAIPARLRRTASLTARTADSWPMSRAPMIDSMLSSFSVSPWSSRPAGMPVHALMTSAMSSAPTRSLTIVSSRPSLGLERSVEVALQGGDLAVEDGRGLAELALALQPVGLAAQLVELLLELADAVQAGLLRLPPGVEGGELLALVCQGLAQGLEALARRLVLLALQVQLLHLQPVHRAAELVDLDRAGVDLHAQAGGRLVDEVDRLVGQLPAADVAVERAAATSAESSMVTWWCAS